MRDGPAAEREPFEQHVPSSVDEASEESSSVGEPSRVWEPITELKSEEPEYVETVVFIPNNQPRNETLVYIPKIPPRKYARKSEEEKVSIAYTFKRAKNNDAVRKCRQKRKEEQMAKDEQIKALQEEVQALKCLIERKDAQIRELESTVRNAAQILCQKMADPKSI
ncbi:hypothetical protein Tcan_18485 [Toxocara canis]|uniref:BZIP domain-containing protein n=1 Tax=Toxocara canis TaxID=6265 RepID=A0A0B2V488_TOXCA|nr:hypothetical protein Tcan_18485 [Toxocara canis]